MMNAANYIIDLNAMESNFTQMQNAIEVALKASLANATEVIAQIMEQTGKEQLHLKTEVVEIVAVKDKVMFLTKSVKLVSTFENFEDMDYTLNSFKLHEQSKLLNAMVEIGYALESGKLYIDDDFKSDGMALASLVLDKLDVFELRLNAFFNGCRVSIKPNEVLVDNKLIYQNGVLYFNAYYCKVLIDLFSSKTVTDNNYGVLYGGKSFSNGSITCRNNE